MAGYTNGPAWVTGGGAEGEALKALGEARAAYAELELRLVEAEAAIADAPHVDCATQWDGPEHSETCNCWKATAPSVVLADHDAAVWDEGWNSWDADKPPQNPYRGGTNA